MHQASTIHISLRMIHWFYFWLRSIFWCVSVLLVIFIILKVTVVFMYSLFFMWLQTSYLYAFKHMHIYVLIHNITKTLTNLLLELFYFASLILLSTLMWIFPLLVYHISLPIYPIFLRGCLDNLKHWRLEKIYSYWSNYYILNKNLWRHHF
jgi:hypothetical protein